MLTIGCKTHLHSMIFLKVCPCHCRVLGFRSWNHRRFSNKKIQSMVIFDREQRLESVRLRSAIWYFRHIVIIMPESCTWVEFCDWGNAEKVIFKLRALHSCLKLWTLLALSNSGSITEVRKAIQSAELLSSSFDLNVFAFPFFPLTTLSSELHIFSSAWTLNNDE